MGGPAALPSGDDFQVVDAALDTQTRVSDFMKLKGTRPWMFCLWGTTPEATSRMTAAWTSVVWTPFRLSCSEVRPKCSMYRLGRFPHPG